MSELELNFRKAADKDAINKVQKKHEKTTSVRINHDNNVASYMISPATYTVTDNYLKDLMNAQINNNWVWTCDVSSEIQ